MRHLLLALAFLAPLATDAQRGPSAGQDSLLRRAQQLVSEGHGSAGRALADSLVTATPAGTMQHAEALYWRAMLTDDVRVAERDYRRVAVEYPLSPRAEESLLRLAQLELTRGDRALAVAHLERLEREHPRGAASARGAYWRARIHLDEGNLPRACAALQRARAGTPAADVELLNQIDYYAQRCLGVDTSAVAVASESTAAPASSTPAPAPAAPARAATAAAENVTGGFTVQVAAYAERANADALQQRLRERGFEARVVGAGKHFRVRVGRYATRGAAQEAAQTLIASKLVTGAWVADAEPE